MLNGRQAILPLLAGRRRLRRTTLRRGRRRRDPPTGMHHSLPKVCFQQPELAQTPKKSKPELAPRTSKMIQPELAQNPKMSQPELAPWTPKMSQPELAPRTKRNGSRSSDWETCHQRHRQNHTILPVKDPLPLKQRRGRPTLMRNMQALCTFVGKSLEC